MSQDIHENQNEKHNLAGVALPDYVLKSASTSLLSKSLIENNRGPTSKEISTLRKRLAQAIQTASVHLAEFPVEQAEVMKYLEITNRKLSQKNITQEEVIKAEENLIRSLVILDRKIKNIKSIQRMIVAVVVSSIFYIFLIFLLQYIVNLDEKFVFLGTPGLILAWGCLGGVTVILFRHRSMMEKKWPFDLRWLWIAVRPLLGLIMGAFIYQAISSGLLLFGSSPSQGIPQTQLLWALAFVGGFSDRFWEFLINSALGPYSQDIGNEK